MSVLAPYTIYERASISYIVNPFGRVLYMKVANETTWTKMTTKYKIDNKQLGFTAIRPLTADELVLELL